MRPKRFPVIQFFLLMLLSLCNASPVLAAVLGNDSVGSSMDTISTDEIRGTVFTATSSFIATNISFHLAGTLGASHAVLAVYDANNPLSEPTSKLFESSVIVFGAGWNTEPVAPPLAITNGQKYYLCVVFNGTASISAETSGGIGWGKAYPPGPPLPDPFGPPDIGNAYIYSIYLQGVAATFTATPSRTPSFTRTATQAMSPTFTVTSSRTLTATNTLTLTSTHTPTRTVTPSATFSRTITQTRTITPTSTITQTATMSPSPTVSATITLTATPTGTVVSTPSASSTPFTVDADTVVAYPSPAKGETAWFYYSTDGPAQARIEIFTVTGERGLELTDTVATAGFQRIRWDISGVAPGVYFYRLRLETPAGTRDFGVRKLVVIK